MSLFLDLPVLASALLLRVLMLFGAPFSCEILAQIEVTRHGVAVDCAGEAVGDRVANLAFRQTAAELNLVAVHRSCQVARKKIALVNSLYARALLLQRQRVFTGARSVFDMNVPLAADVRRGRLWRFRSLHVCFAERTSKSRSATIRS